MINRNSFRHGASRIGKGSGKKKGKGKGVTWDQWTPPALHKLQGKVAATPGVDPADQIAIPVVLLPGEYKAEDGSVSDTYLHRMHKYTEMKNGKKRYPELPCLRGSEHSPQNCLGCLKVERKEWQDASDTKENVLVNMAHLVPYHHTPLMKNGQLQTKKGSNDPIMIWKECYNGSLELQDYASRTNKTCPGCQERAEIRIGGRRYLQLGWGNQKKFAEFQEDVLSRRCKGCGTGAAEIGLRCGSDACKLVIHNIEAGGYTIDQIAQLKENPQVCTNPQCAHANPQNPMYLTPVYRCGYNDDLLGYRADGKRCADGVEAQPFSIYEVVLYLIRKGEGTDSRIHVQKWEPINAFTGWPGAPDPVDITAHLKDVVPVTFDFEGMFNITTADQAKRLGMADPYATPQNYQHMAPQPGAPQGGYNQPPQAGGGYPQAPAPQQGYQQQAPPPAPPQPGYAPQAAPPGPPQPQAPAAAPIAAPYPQAPAAPGMPPAPGNPWGGSGNQ